VKFAFHPLHDNDVIEAGNVIIKGGAHTGAYDGQRLSAGHRQNAAASSRGS